MFDLLRPLTAAFMVIALAGCGNAMKIEDFAQTKPTLVPEEYFAGAMKAWGLFQDRSGAVKRQFVVNIFGEWDGKQLTLTEDFTYDDGETEKRVWVLTKQADGTYTGTADNVVGPAIITTAGNAMNLRYTFDLVAGGKTYRVDFDDWMFLQPDGQRMINRATVTKFGLRVGEVTVFFDKTPGAVGWAEIGASSIAQAAE
jgi:hypothetical protein